MNLLTLTAAVRNGWQAAWARRSPREQQLLGIGFWVLALAALWVLALAPALRTWQEAPARQALLDAQSQRMRQLQAQAQGLQKPAALSRADATQWLDKNLTELGPNARISLQGETATLSLQAAPAAALARWLSLARDNAQALPTQAQLQQVSPAGPGNQNNSPDATWRGSLVLRLP
jgi:general secretion pathway protein M